MIGAFLLQIILIGVNALFASSEIAVISMSETRLKVLAEDGDKRAKRLMALTRQPAKFLATIQVAITLAGLLGGAFAAGNFADPIVDQLMGLQLAVPRSALRSAVVVLITLVLTYFSIVFGELVPKRLAMKESESLALGLSGILYFMSRLCAPLVWLLTASTNGLLRGMGVDPNQNQELVTEDEIKMMLMEGSQQGTIQNDENEIIQNVFELNDTTAEEVSTRRRDVVCLYLSDGMDVWARTIRDSRFTYFPVCGQSQDDVVGTMDDEDTVRQVEIQKIGENCWEIRGSASLEEVAEELEVQLPTDEHETFNGMVCGIVGRVPDEGEQFTCEGYGLSIDVKNVTGHRVEMAVVEKKPQQPAPDQANQEE